MTSRDEPRSTAGEHEPEFEITDGGWDPYITALLTGGVTPSDASAGDEDDTTPVMTFSRRPVAARR